MDFSKLTAEFENTTGALAIDPESKTHQRQLRDLSSRYAQALIQKNTDPEDGKLVIGIGTGRSGSTSLTKLLQLQPNAFVSHERPPRLSWAPNQQRLGVQWNASET